MRTFAAMIGSLVLAACSQGAPSDPSAPSDGRVVITTIVTHDARIAVYSRGHDLRVGIHKLDGTVVADGLTLSELRTQDREAYDLVTSSYASNSGHYLDATLTSAPSPGPAAR